MSEDKQVVELGKRQTALLITLVSFLFVLAIVGIVVSGRNGGSIAAIDKIKDYMTGEEALEAKYYNADGLVEPFAQIPGFNYYKNPDHFNMDYSLGPSGTQAEWNAMYPYRAVFFGAYKSGAMGSEQGYDSTVYVLYSKTPVVDFVSFQYLSTRSQYGHIRATFTTASMSKWGVQSNSEWIVMSQTWSGVSTGNQNLYTYNFTNWTDRNNPYNFDFDYVYMNEGNNNTSSVNGLMSVPNVPYGYLYYCNAGNGPGHGEGETSSSGGSSGGSSSGGSSSGGSSSGGSSSGGSSSGGSSSGDDSSSGSSSGDDSSGGSSSEDDSSGGSSSGDDSSGGSSGGSSSGDDSSGGGSSSGIGDLLDDDSSMSGGSNPDDYPWEEDDGPGLDWEADVPEYSGGREGDDGEKGDTWDLPEYGIPDPPFGSGDLNIPPMPDLDLPEAPKPDFNFPDLPGMPEAEPPTLDYQPDTSGGWPPPFPGYR